MRPTLQEAVCFSNGRPFVGCAFLNSGNCLNVGASRPVVFEVASLVTDSYCHNYVIQINRWFIEYVLSH
jgi:hypothetical protein